MIEGGLKLKVHEKMIIKLVEFFIEKLILILKKIWQILTTSFFRNMTMIWEQNRPLAVVLSFISAFIVSIMFFMIFQFYIIFEVYKSTTEERLERYRVWVLEINKNALKVDEGHKNIYKSDVNESIRYCDKLPQILQVATIKSCNTLKDYKAKN